MMKFKDQLTRQAQIIEFLRHAPDNGLTVTEIFERLKSFDYSVNRKTVARDLLTLSEKSGVYSEGNVPERFFLNKDYKQDFIININEENLQSLMLALSIMGKIAPNYFKKMANETELALIHHLPQTLVTDFKYFKERQYIQDTILGKTTFINNEDLKVALLALRKKKSFSCIYDSQNKTKHENTKRRSFGPILQEMVYGTPYLLVQDLDSKDNEIKRLKVSRISNAKISSQDYRPPKRSMYESWLTSFSGLGGPNVPNENIKITCSGALVEFFMEREIHPTQEIKLISAIDEIYLVTFKMPLAYPLVKLLSGFGGYIEDLEPKKLKDLVSSVWKKGIATLK